MQSRGRSRATGSEAAVHLYGKKPISEAAHRLQVLYKEAYIVCVCVRALKGWWPQRAALLFTARAHSRLSSFFKPKVNHQISTWFRDVWRINDFDNPTPLPAICRLLSTGRKNTI